MMKGDHGAEVIRIESRHEGEPTRHIGRPLKFRNEPGKASLDHPEHGGHAEKILAHLGDTAPEIEAMKGRGGI